jgi:hypothetical protein
MFMQSPKLANQQEQAYCYAIALLDGLPDLSPIYITTIPPTVNITAAMRLVAEVRFGSLPV